MQLGSSHNGYIRNINLWDADVKDLHCIKLDTPDTKGEYPCDCYKKRVELIHDLKVVKLDICRGWWDYMVVQTDLFWLFEKIGFAGFGKWNHYFKKGMKMEVCIQCHRDFPIYQNFKLYDLLSDEYIYRLNRLGSCTVHFYNSTNTIVDSAAYALKDYINECMRYKKLTVSTNKNKVPTDINKRIKMLICVLNEMTENNS